MPPWRSCGGHFYPRSPRGERHFANRRSGCGFAHFYPRSPRGERRSAVGQSLFGAHFYPRSPRGERPLGIPIRPVTAQFLSTLPARGATAGKPPDCDSTILISIHAPREGSDSYSPLEDSQLHPISIHAPREGSDPLRPTVSAHHENFYPRSPRGERLWHWGEV